MTEIEKMYENAGIKMSELIDNLIGYATVSQEINGKWYIAKPYDLQGFIGLIHRIKDSYRVLIGKSRAYHFKEDEVMNDRN